jgi:2-polyprenyl-6-methoxyphenol hydroxylase-like FAD-dependent oxidoreductase
VQACVAGGGPAGMMLGLLLARAGIEVAVIEKHADFLRDFRGDTIHPSTLDIMAELDMLDDLMQLPHQRATVLAGRIGDATVTVADFTQLRARCKFLAFMPQWEFLTFLAERAKRYSGFSLYLQTCATDVLREGDRVVGVAAQTPQGPLEIRAGVTFAADGRDSILRARANLDVVELGAPMDVLWLRLSKLASDPHDTFGYVRDGRILALIDRGEYWQCAYVIPKGTLAELRQRGLDRFRAQVAQTVPFLRDRLGELAGWDDVKLLTVRVNRLRRWYVPGLLCIGDAAHAMSPIGGVGINLAIQDAVAAANVLSGPISRDSVTPRDLARVQRRRETAAKVTQALQLFVQRHVVGRVLSEGRSPALRWLPRLAGLLRPLARISARLVAFGVRPEHVLKGGPPHGR